MRPLTLLLPLLLAACATSPEPARQYGPTITYACTNGPQFSAEYSSDGEAAVLHANSTTHTLTRDVSADGNVYDDSRYTLWTKGEEARLQTAGIVLRRDCHVASGGATGGSGAGS